MVIKEVSKTLYGRLPKNLRRELKHYLRNQGKVMPQNYQTVLWTRTWVGSEYIWTYE